jgi:hypothetical protein
MHLVYSDHILMSIAQTWSGCRTPGWPRSPDEHANAQPDTSHEPRRRPGLRYSCRQRARLNALPYSWFPYRPRPYGKSGCAWSIAFA